MGNEASMDYMSMGAEQAMEMYGAGAPSYMGLGYQSGGSSDSAATTPNGGGHGGGGGHGNEQQPALKRRQSRSNKPLSPEAEEFFACMENNIQRQMSQGSGGEGEESPPPPEPHQWSNFIGGTLNQSSREHRPHHTFKTTPYMDVSVLHAHMQRCDQKPARLPLKRRNSTASVELCLTIDDLDVQGIIKAACLVLYHHICEGCKMTWEMDPRFAIFDDPPEMGGGLAGARTPAPSYDQVHDFYRHVYNTAQMEKDCVIMSLVYIERLLTEAAGKLRICQTNWRSCILAGLTLSSKCWDDLSMWNCDFSRVGRLGLRRINELEVAMLQVLQYNVRVAASNFARYYFHLRHWVWILGVETPGLYDSSPPKRKRAGARDNLLQIGTAHRAAALVANRPGAGRGSGHSRRNSSTLDPGTNSGASGGGLGFTSPFRRLPPCLEELVDMRQTDAGGRVVRPQELKNLERKRSVSHCFMPPPAVEQASTRVSRGKKAALQALILSEVGDVRAHYHVGEATGKGSKMDLAAAGAAATGPGAILGVGISGVVQVVKHKITAVEYAMKTLRLNRLEDFMKMDELQNEIVVMSQLNHPNIVRLLEIYESPARDSISLVMELCTGGELLSRLNAEGHYSEHTCMGMVRMMLSALRHCHEHGICHRDLKLENWVFESSAPGAQLKLIDFGLSKHFTKDEVMHVPVGTPYSIAPECLSGSYTQACDLWSLGVLVYILLTGEPPFKGRDDYQVLEAVKAARWSWPEGLALSPQAKDFVQRLLVLDPKRRLTAEQSLGHPWLQALQPKPARGGLNQGVLVSLNEFRSLCTIKKLVLQMVAFTMEPWQVEELRREFQNLDTECKGLISLKDLRSALEHLDLISDHDQLQSMFEAVGEGHSGGYMRYNDFLAGALMSMPEHRTLDESILKAVFEKFDGSHSGFITGKDLRRFLGKELEDSEVDIMLEEAGVGHGGSMDFLEFKALMTSTLASPSLSSASTTPKTPAAGHKTVANTATVAAAAAAAGAGAAGAAAAADTHDAGAGAGAGRYAAAGAVAPVKGMPVMHRHLTR